MVGHDSWEVWMKIGPRRDFFPAQTQHRLKKKTDLIRTSSVFQAQRISHISRFHSFLLAAECFFAHYHCLLITLGEAIETIDH